LYDGIKVINYLRTDQQFQNTKNFNKSILQDKTNWDDEKYLKPVISDDPLVMQQLNGDEEAEDFSDDEDFAPDFEESRKITENNTNKDNVSLESLSKDELIELLKQAEKKYVTHLDPEIANQEPEFNLLTWSYCNYTNDVLGTHCCNKNLKIHLRRSVNFKNSAIEF